MKQKKSYNWLIPILILLSLLVNACYEDDTCGENMYSRVNISVNSSAYQSNDTLKGTDTEWWFTPLNDTIVLISSDDVDESLGLPLDMDTDTLKLVFHIRNTSATDVYMDTVTFQYEFTDLEEISLNCGFAPVFTMYGGNYTSYALDSIVLNEPIINTDLTEDNVTFYY